MTLLSVEGLSVRYPGSSMPAIDNLDLTIDSGATVALSGRSGSGKTQTALAIMGLLSRAARVEGRVCYDGIDLLTADELSLNRIRAAEIGLVFQDPLASLNPYRRIGEQLELILAAHGTAGATRRRVLEALERTGLPNVERQYRRFPHEMSGGMRQRVVIAGAILCGPRVLLADEPTTALDVTVQAQILNLLRELQADLGLGLLLITHDMAVIATMADRLLVLDQGRVVESGSTRDVFAQPSQPATRDLLAAVVGKDVIERPGNDVSGKAVDSAIDKQSALSVKQLSVVYRERASGLFGRQVSFAAVDNVALELAAGETLAIVGESGSGKTSLARAILGLLPGHSGTVSIIGDRLPDDLGARTRTMKSRLQLVFQDPAAAFDPTMRVADSIAEPLRVQRTELGANDRRQAVEAMAVRLGLEPDLLDRYPHQLSGGQAQRAAIARALICDPDILICDEAVAALDGPVREEVLNLLAEEQRSRGLSMLFITHDLGVARRIGHRVVVMYLGEIVEQGSSSAVFTRPRHPYTRALLDAVPVADPEAPGPRPPGGEPASIIAPPGGCRFHPRCPYAVEICSTKKPEQRAFDAGVVACHRAADLDLTRAQS